MLDSATMSAFQRDGYMVIDPLIDADDVATIRTTLLRLHDNNVGFNEGAQFDAAAPDGDIKARRFPQIINPRIYAPELASSAFHKIGAEIAKQILGEQARFKCDISFLKPAGIGSSTPWHQDEAYGNPAFERKEISIWLAVTHANAENSCMSFIPGSHKNPVILEHRPMNGDPRLHALECIGDFDTSTAVECPLAAGGCTIHTQRTLHYAGPNYSDDLRLAYVLIFDTPPVLRSEPQVFTWNMEQMTDRAARERSWRRRSGFIVYAWRRRHRLRLDRLMGEVRRRLQQVLGRS